MDDNTDGLMTVEAFAIKYRVDASVVRGWVKQGYIDYELVGPRHLKRVRVADIVTPIEPIEPIEPVKGAALVEPDGPSGSEQGTVDQVPGRGKEKRAGRNSHRA